MRVRKNTIIEIGEGRYRILGKTSMKWKDYYLAWQIDENGDCLEDAKTILYEDCEDGYGFEDDEDMEVAVEDICFDFVQDENLSKLLWEIFSEQIKV